MCIRTSADGQLYCECEECSKKEWAGSFDDLRFRDYLKTLGWQVVKMGYRWVRLCKECYDDTPHW